MLQLSRNEKVSSLVDLKLIVFQLFTAGAVAFPSPFVSKGLPKLSSLIDVNTILSSEVPSALNPPST